MTAVEHPVHAEELMAYLDGELRTERAVVVQAHLSTCAVCQQLRSDLGGISGQLAQWEIEEPPADVKAPVISVHHPSAVQRSRWFSPLRIHQLAGVAAVSILVVVAFSINYFEGRYSQASDSRSPDMPETLNKSPRLAAEEAPSIRLGGAAGAPVEAPTEQSYQPLANPATVQALAGPKIARTARLRLLAKDFDAARRSIDEIISAVAGFVGQVDVTGVQPASRRLSATLRVPADKLDAALIRFKALGEVLEESQNADDVTEQVTDLEARLANARNTEKRLNDLLQRRTGNLADVLAAEREVARVREEIERLDAQRKNLDQRVTYATVMLQVEEERKASLSMGPLTASARFRNAAVDGFRGAFQSLLEATLVAARVTPVLVLWALILAWPARLILRWTRRARA